MAGRMGDIEKTIDILQPPEFFGEMAILEGAPRSATAQAMRQTKDGAVIPEE